jgi:hypothetical protein
MAITVYIGKEAERTRLTLELKAKRSLDGNIMIFDHQEMDIVVMPDKNKVVAFAKDDFSDTVYESQSRLFDFLKHRGIITYEAIRGGSVYGSLEGTMAESKDQDANVIDYTIYGIYKFLKEERPYYDYIEDYEQMLDDYYTHPTDEDSTELGEVPHSDEKGALKPGYNYEPYWMSYMLEETKKAK